jgi:KaiC/GvpD/RAD55 family RecA-like ATPase
VCGLDCITIESLVRFNEQGTIAHIAGAVQSSATVSIWILHSDHPMNDGIIWLANLKVELKLVRSISMSAVLGTGYYSTWHGCDIEDGWGLLDISGDW